eukprot:TRINITY_DN73718_c0_g1_i1.p1 TRINITY_DN73718_c0_g1~~TRINITY_DN73718_c0_g1_i1.p1  ORF type:complete len:629 (+),score=107.99 TRINITY_DN73718_c0_g1_i1:177-2063(+)
MRANQAQSMHAAAEASIDTLQEPAEPYLSLEGNSIHESSSKDLTVKSPEFERSQMREYKEQRRVRSLVPLATVVIDTFAETREGMWATGDKVQVRDDESAAWMDGKVVSVRPLRVQLIGGKGAYTWNQIQPQGYTSCEAQAQDKRRHDAHCRRSQYAARRLENTRYCARRRLQRESEERAKQADKELAQHSKPFKRQQRPRAPQYAGALAWPRFRDPDTPAKEPSAAGERLPEASLRVVSEAAGGQLSLDAGEIKADLSKSREASSVEECPPQDFDDDKEHEILTSGAVEAASTIMPCMPDVAEGEATPASTHTCFPVVAAESNREFDAVAAHAGAQIQTTDMFCPADAAAEKSFCTRQFYQILGEMGLTAPEALEKLSNLELQKLASDLGIGETRHINSHEELQLALMHFFWSDRAKRTVPRGRHKHALEQLARHSSAPGRDEASVRALRDRLTELEVHEDGPLSLVRLREVFAGLAADFDSIALLPADEVRRLAGHLGLPGEKAAGIIARLKSLAWSERAVRRSPQGLQAEKLAKLSRTRSVGVSRDTDMSQSCGFACRPHTANAASRESEMTSSEICPSGGEEICWPELPGPDFVDNQMPQRPPMRLTKARERTMIGDDDRSWIA